MKCSPGCTCGRHSKRQRPWLHGPKSPEHREKIAAAQRGVPKPQSAQRGEANPMYGKPGTLLGRTGELHPAWKGDAALPTSIHSWLNQQHPRTGTCVGCGEEAQTGYAYLRHPEPYSRDVRDYRELCSPCHAELDQERYEGRVRDPRTGQYVAA